MQRTKHTLYLLVGGLLIFQSCTFKRYWKNPESKVKIYTNAPCTIEIDSNVMAVDSVVHWPYRSSREDVRVVMRHNNRIDTITLQPKETKWYIPPPDTATFTFRQLERYVNEETHVYRYPTRIRIRYEEDGMHFKTYWYPESVRGQKNLLISIPEFNQFYVDRGPGGYGSSFGFFGVGLGMEYFTAHNRYVQVLAEFKMDFPLPVPVSLNYIGDHAHTYNYAVSAQYFTESERWSFGGGLGYNAVSYVLRHRVRTTPTLNDSLVYQNTYQALSVPVTAKWRFSQKGLLVLNYSPMFTTVSDTRAAFSYSHTLSLGLQVRLELNRRRNEGLR